MPLMFPSALTPTVKVAGWGPAITLKDPLNPFELGNCCKIDEGTVKLPAPTVVTQTKSALLVTAVKPPPDVELDEPMISSRSEAFPRSS